MFSLSRSSKTSKHDAARANTIAKLEALRAAGKASPADLDHLARLTAGVSVSVNLSANNAAAWRASGFGS